MRACLLNSSGPKSVRRLLQPWKFYTVIIAITFINLLLQCGADRHRSL